VVKRLGVDYETVSARNPRIVYASIAAFGQSGPNRDIPAHDLAVEALSGVVSVNLGDDGEPAMPGIPAADMGLVADDLRRHRDGALPQGADRPGRLPRHVHAGRADGLAANVLGPVFVEKRPPVPKHERPWGGAALYRIYRTRDQRHVVLGAQEIKFVRNLLAEFGRPDLVALAERGPGPHQQPLVDFLQSRFETRTQAEWVDWFRGRDIGFAPVRNLREAFDDPQLRERGMLIVDDAGIEHVGVPIKFQDEPAVPRLSVPGLGEHNAALADLAKGTR